MKNEDYTKVLVRVTTAIMKQFITTYGLNESEAFRISYEAFRKEMDKMTEELKEN